MRVLIAHAQRAVREELRELLERLGYEVGEAEGVEQLEAECSRLAPDVTLLQDGLSSGPAIAVVAGLKSHPNAYASAVVLIVREVDAPGARGALDAGVHDVLVEPLQAGEVMARVRAAARTKSLQDELLAQGRRLQATFYEDALTGLFNRRFILTQVGALISGARRHGRPLSVVMVDVDHFKSINDSYGHDVGDRVLTATARAMRERLRAEDYIGRLGGEEFLAVLPDVGEYGAEAVAESLRRCVAETEIPADGGSLRVTVSAGWATWGDETPEQLLKRADDAMYRAKAAGRDAVARG